MSNESKIGLLAIITVALFIIGFKFIKGQNVLSSSLLIYAKYDNVDQLAISSPVLINGLQIGVVNDLYLNPDDPESVIALLDIDKGIKIHKEAVAEIKSVSLMGGMGVQISNNKPCNGDDCIKSGEYIEGRTLGLLQAMIPAGDLNNYLDIVGDNIGPMLDTINDRLGRESNDNMIGKIMQDLESSMANLKTATNQLNTLLANSSGKLDATLNNAASITGNLKDSNEKISTMLDNFATLSGNLKDVKFKETFDNANTMLGSADEAVVKLQTTLDKADAALSEFGALAKNINEGDGTISMLMKDEEFAEKLNKTVGNLDALLIDFKERPYIYMPLKSRRKVKKWNAKDEEEGN